MRSDEDPGRRAEQPGAARPGPAESDPEPPQVDAPADEPPVRTYGRAGARRRARGLRTVVAAPFRALGRLTRSVLVVPAAIVSVAVIAMVVSAIAGGPDDDQTLRGPLTWAVTGTTDRITPGEADPRSMPAPAEGVVRPSAEEWTALLPTLEESAAADPTDDYAQRRLALAYYNLGRLDEAEAIYLRLLDAGEDPVLRNRLGNILRDKGDLAGAEAVYRAVIAAAPTLAAAYLNLAEVLWRQSRDGKATAVIDQGLAAVAAGDRTALERAGAVLDSPAP